MYGVFYYGFIYKMLRLLLNRAGWKYNGLRFTKKVVFTGNMFCVCPGRVNTWHQDIEAFFKRKAYTSELGIDWSYEYITKRSFYRIHRGIYVEVDEWLFQQCI
jgi:hypothetical protein